MLIIVIMAMIIFTLKRNNCVIKIMFINISLTFSRKRQKHQNDLNNIEDID